jgi:hypothetical protein
MTDAHPAAMFTGGNAADNHAQLSLRSGEWRLAQLVAMRGDAWTAGYVVACAALH